MKFQKMVLVALLSGPAFAGESESVRDRVAVFLESNVMGRTQHLSATGTIDGEGKIFKVDFEADIQYSGLTKTSEGLVFEERRDVKQTNTQIDAKGVPIGQPVKTDRVVTLKYAVGERKTTNSLVGLKTVTSNTLEDSTGVGFVCMIEINADGKELYVYDSMSGFSEASMDGRLLTPVSTASSSTLFINKDGKLETSETLKFYSVDVNKDFARKELNRFNISAIEPAR